MHNYLLCSTRSCCCSPGRPRVWGHWGCCVGQWCHHTVTTVQPTSWRWWDPVCLEKSAGCCLGFAYFRSRALQGFAREVTEAPTSPSASPAEHGVFWSQIHYQIFLLLDIFIISEKKIMILQLRLHFKKYMFKIQGNNYMSTGGSEGFLMNFLGVLPDLVMFLMII